jgi:hypothetical protein
MEVEFFLFATEAKSSPLGRPRHSGGPKIDIRLKTIPKPENKNYGHFRPFRARQSASYPPFKS